MAVTSTTEIRSTTAAAGRNIALVVARVFAGALGLMQLSGAVFFLFIAPQEAVWKGPWLDVPVVAIMITGMLLKVAIAIVPRLASRLRISLGLVAVSLGVAITLIKIPVYEEPEGVLFLVLDAILLAMLLLARRSDASGPTA